MNVLDSGYRFEVISTRRASSSEPVPVMNPGGSITMFVSRRLLRRAHRGRLWRGLGTASADSDRDRRCGRV